MSESEYYTPIEKYKDTLNAIREMGVFILIDRVGSLHTSYLYMRDLDIDYMRFDSFYTKEIQKPKFKTTLEGFNLIMHNNGIKSWIKMVEDKESLTLVKEIGIDYIQGKYLAPLQTYN